MEIHRWSASEISVHLTMKKLLFILLVPFAALGQIQISEAPKRIEVGEARRAGSILATVSYYPDKDTSVTIMFKNEKYSTISDYQSVRFYGGIEDMNTIHKTLLTILTKELDYKMNISLGKEAVILNHKKSMGIDMVWFWTNSGYVTLREKDINKMFGK